MDSEHFTSLYLIKEPRQLMKFVNYVTKLDENLTHNNMIIGRPYLCKTYITITSSLCTISYLF